MPRFKVLSRCSILPETHAWFNHCHASTLVKIGENDFLCAFMAGEREGRPDMSIWLSRCRNGSWLEPIQLKAVYHLPHWNPVLHADRRRVHLYYQVGPSVPQWYTMHSVSDDLGETWSHSREAIPGDHTPRISSRNKLLVAADGSWLGPCSVETDRHWDAYIDVSRDGGETWRKRRIPMNHVTGRTFGGGEWDGLEEGVIWASERSAILRWDGVIQPTLWESAPGVCHVLLRSTRGVAYRSDSADSGETWSEAYPTEIPNNNSGLDIVRLDDGTLALASNPVAGNWNRRSPLSVALSRDNGATFGERLDLETRDGEYSYPAIIAEHRRLHLTYTWNRRTIQYCALEVEP